jgi:MFS family permease
MPQKLPNFRSHITLALMTILHAFTHAYGSMLVPLYLQMVDDLKLEGVRAASAVVTVYGVVYNLGSYPAGVLADRFNRKALLGIGLLGNAAAIVGIGLSRDYSVILSLGVMAGLFGTLFHPAAAALAPSHYPKNPGMAIGLLGAGSGLGFFFGPQIAGWRTHSATWHFDHIAPHIAQWQKPCIEMGILGFIFGIIFLFVGAESNHAYPRPKTIKLDRILRNRVLQSALILMFRDFCGIAALSLAAIYLQRVFHVGVERAGWMVGLMMLPSVVANPLCVYITRGKRRLWGLSTILICGSAMAASIPIFSAVWVLPMLCVFQSLQLGSFAVGDAAMLERVAPDVRGRVVGMFMIIAGTAGALGPWAMGAWTDWLGPRAAIQSAYFAPFATLGACLVIASFGSKAVARYGPVLHESPVKPLQEISPSTMGAVA